MTIREGKLIYHLTTLDVFESIVQNKLLSRKDLNSLQLGFVDTADPEILHERKRLSLEGCIPFHFHIHTSYDTYVKDNNKDKVFIYLCVHRNYAAEHNFLVLPIHPVASEQPKIYSYDEGIDEIDWEIMELNKEEATIQGVEERYRRQVRMAECLSPEAIPIENIFSICVPDESIKMEVNRILLRNGINKWPYIDVRPYMFNTK